METNNIFKSKDKNNNQQIFCKSNEGDSPSLLHTKMSGFYNKPQTSNSLDSYIRSKKFKNNKNNLSSQGEKISKLNKIEIQYPSNSSKKLFRFTKAFEEGIFRVETASSCESIKDKKCKSDIDENTSQSLLENSENDLIKSDFNLKVNSKNNKPNISKKNFEENKSNMNNIKEKGNIFIENTPNAHHYNNNHINNNLNNSISHLNSSQNQSHIAYIKAESSLKSQNCKKLPVMENRFNYNSSEIQTSTNFFNLNSLKNHNSLKIDYSKPGKSSSDILSYILKNDLEKKKRIDPLISFNTFRNTSNSLFSKKTNLSKVKPLEIKKNERGNKIDSSIFNFKVSEKVTKVNSENKLTISTGNIEFNDNTTHGGIPNGHVPIPAIFRSTKNSYFNFKKKN